MATKWDVTKAKIRLIIAGILATLFGFCLFGLFMFELPESNADVLKVVTGFLGGAFVTMITYYFGDSEGKDKPVTVTVPKSPASPKAEGP